MPVSPPKAAAEQRWIVSVDYISVEKRGEDPVRYERGEEFPNPSKSQIDMGWVCPMRDEDKPAADKSSEGGA